MKLTVSAVFDDSLVSIRRQKRFLMETLYYHRRIIQIYILDIHLKTHDSFRAMKYHLHETGT